MESLTNKPEAHARGENPCFTHIDEAAFIKPPVKWPLLDTGRIETGPNGEAVVVHRIRPMMAPASNDPGYYDPASGEVLLDTPKKPGHKGGSCYAC